MKIVIVFAACFFVTVLIFISCSKDKDQQPSIQPPIPGVNQPPVARAGADSTFTQPSCNVIIFVPLDGSKSSDPENKITSITWRNIESSPDIIIRGGNTLYATVEIRRPGVYSFELSIVDNGNLTSKDIVLITVIRATPKEYDFDVTSNTKYIFEDNFKDCYYTPCSYYDYTEIQGTGNFAPLGLFNIYVSEYPDTAALSYANSSYLSLFKDNNTSIHGTTTVNFKKLIQQGGGAFNGNFTVTGGSAQGCVANIYNSLAPLAVTGNLDTATKKVSIRIKGKTFF